MFNIEDFLTGNGFRHVFAHNYIRYGVINPDVIEILEYNRKIILFIECNDQRRFFKKLFRELFPTWKMTDAF